MDPEVRDSDVTVNHEHREYCARACVVAQQYYIRKVPVILNDSLPQSRDRSRYVSRRTLAPPPLWVQKHTDLRAHDLAQ
jgi:hypothetical protein